MNTVAMDGGLPTVGGDGALPIETVFTLPSPLPSFPPGGGFAKGSINLGGLEVRPCSSLTKVWAALEGGPENLGATFFKPSPVPAGFSLLGCYAQPNNRPLFGWVLCGRDIDGGPSGSRRATRSSGPARAPRSGNMATATSGSRLRRKDTEPSGYLSRPLRPPPRRRKSAASGRTLPTSARMTSGCGGTKTESRYTVRRPTVRGSGAAGVRVGTCMVGTPPLWCLKNTAPLSRSMPGMTQIEALVRAYSPWIYFHPDEPYLPSSVGWFFDNGALLYKKDAPAPAAVDSAGSNLPQGANAGECWLDLPADEAARNRLKTGDLQSSEAYVHVKPMLGGTFTDVVVWVFYPFNGPARAKVEFLNISFKRIGEHIGDWEHVTLRVSNFSGELRRVFFAEHSSGEWKEASEVEFQGGNKPVAYAALHGHAAYPHPGLVLQGGAPPVSASASETTPRKAAGVWTPARNIASSLLTIWVGCRSATTSPRTRLLPRKLRERLEKLLKSLPPEVLGEEGPTGPKEKRNWAGDEG
ncbi:unnamed protein product [Spirodela intermedia]|uniref:Uncharacterized protein n=1 Tax=Spirodela intermedia TaxID=51605 RepID=A0A7I8IMQ9_SPIIN|nr:unnamed protein product [Spirodela intermedia]CAA6659079.1 unnamed protein product [Spirodela intermedia]